jgi:prophage regulatory protein
MLETPYFYRINELHHLLGVGRSTIWSWVKTGQFPKPIKLSASVTAWRAEDVSEWMNKKTAAIDSIAGRKPDLTTSGG